MADRTMLIHPIADDPDIRYRMILIGVLVKKLGGKVTITQADIDEVAYCRIIEDGSSGRDVILSIQERTKQ